MPETTKEKPQLYIGLYKVMKAKGIDQVELAKMIHMTPSTFSRKFNRVNGNDFSFSQANDIQKALNISASDFF